MPTWWPSSIDLISFLSICAHSKNSVWNTLSLILVHLTIFYSYVKSKFMCHFFQEAFSDNLPSGRVKSYCSELEQLSVYPFIIILINEICLYELWIPWCQKPFVFSLCVIIFHLPETWSSLNKYFIKHTNFPLFSIIYTLYLSRWPFSHAYFLPPLNPTK